jgi:hypothetical protein
MGRLLVVIGKSEQRRFREWPRQKLDTHRDPLYCETCWHCQGWKTQDGTQLTIIPEALVLNYPSRHQIGRDQRRLMIERRVRQRIQLVIRHQRKHYLPHILRDALQLCVTVSLRSSWRRRLTPLRVG